MELVKHIWLRTGDDRDVARVHYDVRSPGEC